MSDDASAQRDSKSDRDRKVADLRQSRAPLSRVAGEMIAMSAWKKKTLAGFLFLAAVGGVLWVAGSVNTRYAPSAPTPAGDGPAESALPEAAESDDRPAQYAPGLPGRSFVDNHQQPQRDPGDSTISTTPETVPPSEPGAEEPVARDLPWSARVGGWMAKLGLSFAGGLVLGIFFRVFLKTMAAITALAAGLVIGLSYFEVVNIDFTTMQANYDSFAGWLADQGWRVKELLAGVLPSAIFVGLGFFVGFLRR